MSADDWGWDDTPERAAALPNGKNVGTITEAKLVYEPDRPRWVDPVKNPQAEGIKVVVQFKDELGNKFNSKTQIPRHWRGLVEGLGRCAGVTLPPAVSKEAFVESLVGRTVICQTVTTEPNDKGFTYVNVKEWLPSPSQPLPPSKAAPAPPAAKAKKPAAAAAVDSEDTIPF
jgi:hypothetical protein